MHLAVKRERKREGKNGRNGKKDNWHFRTEGRKERNKEIAVRHNTQTQRQRLRGKKRGEGKRKLAAVNHTCNPSRSVRPSGRCFSLILKEALQSRRLVKKTQKNITCVEDFPSFIPYLFSVLPPNGLRGPGRRHGPWAHLPQQPGMCFQTFEKLITLQLLIIKSDCSSYWRFQWQT